MTSLCCSYTKETELLNSIQRHQNSVAWTRAIDINRWPVSEVKLINLLWLFFNFWTDYSPASTDTNKQSNAKNKTQKYRQFQIVSKVKSFSLVTGTITLNFGSSSESRFPLSTGIAGLALVVLLSILLSTARHFILAIEYDDSQTYQWSPQRQHSPDISSSSQ